jgi:hypothetical protein
VQVGVYQVSPRLSFYFACDRLSSPPSQRVKKVSEATPGHGVRRGPCTSGGPNSDCGGVGRSPGGGPGRLDCADAAGGGRAAGGRRGARPRRPHLRRPRAQGRFPPVPAAGRTEGECQGAHHPHLPRSRQGNRRRGIKGQSRGAACQEARQTLVNIRLASSFSTKPLTRGLWRFQVSAPLFGDKITIITEKDTTLLSFEDSCAID